MMVPTPARMSPITGLQKASSSTLYTLEDGRQFKLLRYFENGKLISREWREKRGTMFKHMIVRDQEMLDAAIKKSV